MGENNKVIPQKKGNSKNKKKGILAIVLVLALVIGGTLAYLGTRSEDKENVFKGSNDISLTLTEPKWEGTEPYQTEPEKERAKDYTPNSVYKKDPQLTNSTSGVADKAEKYAEWVAIKVDFEIENPLNRNVETATWGGIKAIVDVEAENGTKYTPDSITDPNGEWILIATSTNPTGTGTPALSDNDTYAIYMYKTTLDVNDTTDPLFSQIQIKHQDYLQPQGKPFLPEFHINVYGAAIKNESMYNSGSQTSPTYTLATSIDNFSSSIQDEEDELAAIKNALIDLF